MNKLRLIYVVTLGSIGLLSFPACMQYGKVSLPLISCVLYPAPCATGSIVLVCINAVLVQLCSCFVVLQYYVFVC